MTFRSGLAAAFVLSLVALDARDAHACAGQFRVVTEVATAAVSDHRIVFKIGKDETVLWDQMRYTGAPSEFAWVLPVHEGAKLELSHDEFMAALDKVTATKQTVRQKSCPDDSSGCGGGDGTTFGDGVGSAGGDRNATIVSQQVVGPYEVTTLKATGAGGISDWLVTHNFAIPDPSRAIIDQYTAEQFEFLAVRLRPGQGVQAMQPVRVVMPGAGPTLPLRMIAAGAADHVGISMWIVAEGHYEAQNFPNAVIDDTKLVGNADRTTSNFADVTNALLATNDGRTWITEWAEKTSELANESELDLAYKSTCQTLPLATEACDAGAEAGPDDDAGSDAGAPSPPCTQTVDACSTFDDFDVAYRGLNAPDIWITRMRANLPLAALTTDLQLQATADQTTDNNGQHTAVIPGTCPDDEGCNESHRSRGSLLLTGLTAIAIAWMARRRR